MEERWQDTLYEKTREEELVGLERRRAADGGCRVEDVEGTLAGLYTMEGADWLGRGEVQDLILAAQIAAHEQFIAAWKAAEGR
jgi:hypothetical protein